MIDEEGWTRVPEAEELGDGEMISADVGDDEILLARVGDHVFAVDNVCTHSWGRLDEGVLDGHEVQCPLHVGRFDLRTGRATRRPARTPLRTYAVRIVGGQVYVAATVDVVGVCRADQQHEREQGEP